MRLGEAGEEKDATRREEAAKPVNQLDHEAEFERAWIGPAQYTNRADPG